MTIHINDALPVLEAILQQQRVISDRLRKLIQTFKREPEPIEPTLRLMLKPLRDGITDMRQTLSQPLNPTDSSESRSES